MLLRDYQIDSVISINASMMQNENPLCVLPTGSGKTVIMCEVLLQAQEKYPTLKAIVLLRSVELVNQTATRLAEYGIKGVGMFCASLSKKELTPITVASIQSISEITTGEINLLIIDEVHNYNHSLGKYLLFVQKLKELRPKMKVIGFSATPFRNNGYIYGKDKLFSKISYRKTLTWMIDNGYLVKPILKSCNQQFNTKNIKTSMGDYNIKELENLCEDASKIQEQINDALPRLEGCKKIVWFCVSIKHAELVEMILKIKQESVCIIHSKQKDDIRNSNFKIFKNTFEIRNMVNVSVLKEGVDIVDIDAIVMMRPTRSANFYIQSVGRGLRTASSKTNCLVLDYGNIVSSLGTLEDPVLIFTGNKNKKKKEEEPVKVCPKCFSYVVTKLNICPDCMFEFPKTVQIKNTTNTATEEGNLLGTKVAKTKKMPVDKIVISDHTSKAGNKCSVIEYHNTKSFWDNVFKEYYVKTSLSSMYHYTNRLDEIKDQTPFELLLEQENNKFWRIKKIILKEVIDVRERDTDINY